MLSIHYRTASARFLTEKPGEGNRMGKSRPVRSKTGGLSHSAVVFHLLSIAPLGQLSRQHWSSNVLRIRLAPRTPIPPVPACSSLLSGQGDVVPCRRYLPTRYQ